LIFHCFLPSPPCPQGLRLHDNPALLEACKGAKHVYPIFIIDPFFLKSSYK
jgi:cryptochrome